VFSRKSACDGRQKLSKLQADSSTSSGKKAMNQDRVEGHWLQFKGKLQERHGITPEEAGKQVTAWRERNPSNFFERY